LRLIFSNTIFHLKTKKTRYQKFKIKSIHIFSYVRNKVSYAKTLFRFIIIITVLVPVLSIMYEQHNIIIATIKLRQYIRRVKPVIKVKISLRMYNYVRRATVKIFFVRKKMMNLITVFFKYTFLKKYKYIERIRIKFGFEWCTYCKIRKKLKKNSTVWITTEYGREPAQFWSDKMAPRFLNCT